MINATLYEMTPAGEGNFEVVVEGGCSPRAAWELMHGANMPMIGEFGGGLAIWYLVGGV